MRSTHPLNYCTGSGLERGHVCVFAGASTGILGRIQRQRGISMIETMIGLVIFGVVLTMVLGFQDRQTQIQKGRVIGEEIRSVQAAFLLHFKANQSAILEATGAADNSNAAVRQQCVVQVNPNLAINPGTNGRLMWSGGAAINDGLKTCAFDLSLLQALGTWPRHLPVVQRTADVNVDWRYVAIVRRVRGPGPDGLLNNADDVLTNDAEMLVLRMAESAPTIAANAWRNDRALQIRTLSAVRELGSTGGFIPIGNAGACRANNSGAANSIQVCGDGWQVDLAGWIDGAGMTALRDSLPAN